LTSVEVVISGNNYQCLLFAMIDPWSYEGPASRWVFVFIAEHSVPVFGGQLGSTECVQVFGKSHTDPFALFELSAGSMVVFHWCKRVGTVALLTIHHHKIYRYIYTVNIECPYVFKPQGNWLNRGVLSFLSRLTPQVARCRSSCAEELRTLV